MGTRLTWFHKRDSSLLSHLLPSQPPFRTITVWLSWAQLCLKSPAQQTRSSRRMPCLPLAQLAPPENLLQQDQQPTKYANAGKACTPCAAGNFAAASCCRTLDKGLAANPGARMPTRCDAMQL